MSGPVRDHRVQALCDWLDIWNRKEAFWEEPDYLAKFGDMTDAELKAVIANRKAKRRRYYNLLAQIDHKTR